MDRRDMALRGSPVAVIENIAVTSTARAMYSISRTGTLAYVPSEGDTSRILVWLDRHGNETAAFKEPGSYVLPRISPDGRHVVVVSAGSSAAGGDLWVIDLDRGTRLPLTNGGDAGRAIWSPDGQTITFQGGTDVYTVAASGGPATPLLSLDGTQFPDAWTPDGRTLIFNQRSSPAAARDLWMVRPGEAARPLLTTPFGERGAAISPNGQHLAFVSTDAGRDDVYVVSFPDVGAKVPVSPAGGHQPVWSRDGTELYFRQGDWLMAAPVQLRPFHIGVPQRLFQLEQRLYGGNPNVPGYDVAPDGRFLALRQQRDIEDNQIRVIVNWPEELKRLSPVN